MASATVWAQSAASSSTTTAQKIEAEKRATVRTLETKRAAVFARWQGELAVIDRLKPQKKTWNGERELKAKMSAANETGDELKKLDSQLAAARSAYAGARKNLMSAIDYELTTKPDVARTKALQDLRSLLAPPAVKPSVHRIAIPSLEVDPKADPEDLDAQASELRQLEVELDRQVKFLDTQSEQLKSRDAMRREHDRTIALNNREDNTPTRNPSQGADRSNGKTAAEDADGSPAPTTGEPPPMEPGGGGMFESEATVILQDVIDPGTIDTLASAGKSGDSSKRSKAAAKARDAVKAKLELVRQKRALIEQRAKQLRK